jgi:Ca-activated chloride channel family protein
VIAGRLENPAALQLLWFVPLFIFLAWFFAKVQRRRMTAAISAKLLPLLAASVSAGRRRFKLMLQLLVLTFFVIALARPQSGEAKQKVKAEGVEIMLLVDVSNSMLAEDVRPSRLELAKKELARFMDLSGGDKVGLVAFAGSAVTLSPLTNDKNALKMFLDSLSSTAVSTQGTDFKRALNEAKSAFNRGGVDPGDDGVVTRVVVIASDGEDQEKGAMDVARELADGGVKLYTMAFGTERGGPIPIRDDRGNLVGTLRDKQGKEVVSKVGGEALRQLASEGRGQFYHVAFGGDAVRSMIADLNRLQKAQFDDAEITSYDENYQGWLLAAIILALIELILGERAKAGRLWRGRFEVAKS